MSTSIDSLQIEIQSDSTSVAAGIDALAASLSRLKQNGSVGTAVKNLNNLRDALRGMSNVTSNADKISSLADAMVKLKSVGSVGPGVKKLSESLRTLGSVDYTALSRVAESSELFERIAHSLSILSGVRAGGLGTMVNALARIGQVTDSLDDETITRFAARVKELNNALTPLSNKMTTIQQGLRGLNNSSRSTASGFQHLGSKVNTTTLNMASLITVVQGVVAALRPIAMMLGNIISEAIEWDGIAARFGRGFGVGAEETYQWIQRLNEEMGINVQQFMQYSSVYATMLTGFGVAVNDANKMALGYTELTYDIWAGYNDIYKNYADAADAVKSAIAGEVEPIRRAGFTIVESTLEQTAANHGLEISLEKATEAQKSYLRYLTLVDQAHAQNLVGTYAREINTAEGAMRTFAQAAKSMAQALGSLFLPILIKVIPWIVAFIEIITSAIRALAAFFGITIGGIDWSGFSKGVGGGAGAIGDVADSANDATGALEDTAGAAGGAKKAIEDLKRATIGIDELNVISPPNESGGGGGGSGAGVGGGGGGGFEDLDVDSLWDESIFGQIESKVDDIKAKIMDFFHEWETEIKIIGGLLGLLGMAKMLEHLGSALMLGDKFLGVMNTIAKLAVTGIIIVLQYSLMTEYFESYIDGEGLKEYIKALFVGAIATGILYSMWGPTGLVIGLAVTAAASLKAVIENGGIDSVESAVVALTGLAAAAGAVYEAVKILGPILANSQLGAFFALLKEGHGFLPTLAATFPKLSGAISSVASVVGPFLAGISAPVWAAIVAAIVVLIGTIMFLRETWDEVTAAAKRFYDENLAPKITGIVEHFKKLIEALGPVGDVIVDVLSGIWGAVKNVIDWFREFINLEDILYYFGWVVTNVFGGVIGGAINAALGIIEGFVEGITGTVKIVSGVIEAIVSLFSGDLEGAWEACEKIGSGIVDVFEGLYDMTIGPIVEFVEGIIDWCVYLWDELVGHSIIPDTIDGIVDCFLGLPGKVLGSVADFVGDIIGKFADFGSNIVEKISSGWEKVKSWWGGKSGMETTEVGVSLVKKGWKTVKDWIGKIPGVEQTVELAKKGWNTVKNWVGSIPTLDQTIKLVKSGWSTVKGWIGDIPALSQGIKLIKSGWSSISKWVGSIPTLSQSIKLAKSGWSTIKKWIGSIPNVSQGVSLAKKGWSTVSKWIGGMPSLNAKIGLAKNGWTSISKWLGNLSFTLGFKLPKIGIEWGKKEYLGFTISYPKRFYTYAKGGFPDIGELFVAREAGPEMVGKIGSKSTVANNDQIVEGISEGVYAAVLAAMKASESNGSQAVNVYLDGKQITSAVERRQHERGAALMGRQVYTY